MSTSPYLPDRGGLTGPHPNPLTDLRLYKPCGGPVSLHRYSGRWIILRLTDQQPEPDTTIEDLAGADFVPINVVAGPILPVDTTLPVMFDTTHGFARRFPAIDSPATFVIDPEGRLIAILDDHGWPEFLEGLLKKLGRASAHGAIDQQDLRR